MLRGFAPVNYGADDLEAAREWSAEFLGIAPYFERPVYSEFRVGDCGDGLGLTDSRSAPASSSAPGPGGAVLYWHVDDVAAALERLLSMGAKEYEALTRRGEAGVVTASGVDPLGNVLGIMYNPHYLEVLGSVRGKRG